MEETRSPLLKLVAALTVLLGTACSLTQDKDVRLDLPEPLQVYDAFIADFSRLVDLPPNERDVDSLKKYVTEERFGGVRATFEEDLIDVIDTDERLDHIVEY